MARGVIGHLAGLPACVRDRLGTVSVESSPCTSPALHPIAGPATKETKMRDAFLQQGPMAFACSQFSPAASLAPSRAGTPASLGPARPSLDAPPFLLPESLLDPLGSSDADESEEASTAPSTPPPELAARAGKKKSLSSGSYAASTFHNDHLFKRMALTSDGSEPCGTSVAFFVPPTSATPVEKLREQVGNTDWKSLVAEKKTRFCMDPKWSASVQRCETLACLCSMGKATQVLEVGSFCGVATLSMAAALPTHGRAVGLDIEPYLVDMGQRAALAAEMGKRAACTVQRTGGKAEFRCGDATEALTTLALEGAKFDIAVIDADKGMMLQYFQRIVSSGLMNHSGNICVDVTPTKARPPLRCERFGFDPEEVSGEESVEVSIAKFQDYIESNREAFAAVNCFQGLLVIRLPPAPKA